jgi:hypothetical protein
MINEKNGVYKLIVPVYVWIFIDSWMEFTVETEDVNSKRTTTIGTSRPQIGFFIREPNNINNTTLVLSNDDDHVPSHWLRLSYSEYPRNRRKLKRYGLDPVYFKSSFIISFTSFFIICVLCLLFCIYDYAYHM